MGSNSSVPWPSPQDGEEDHLGKQEACPFPNAFKWKGKMAFSANTAMFLDFSQHLWPAYSLYSHCIVLLTAGLIHSFHEQPLYLTPSPTSPTRPSSMTWHITVFHDCWVTGLKTLFSFRIFLPGPLWPVHCSWVVLGPLPPVGRVQHARFHSNVPQKMSFEQGELHFRVLSLLPLFLHKYRLTDRSYIWLWSQSDDLLFNLLFGTWITSHKRSVLPKCHFNQRWL